MNRAQTPETAFSREGTVRVLAKVPYVSEDPAPSDAPGSPHRAPRPGFLTYFLSDPVRRGLALGTAVTVLLGAVWFFATRDGKQVAQNTGDKPWEAAVPRPDAPEAPAWNPAGNSTTAAVQSTQAQPLGASASYGPTKSPLGFDLPPGNGWGPPEGAISAATPGDGNLPGTAGGLPILSWERPSLPPSPVGPADGLLTSSGPASQQGPVQSAPVEQALPWANATAYTSGTVASAAPGISPAPYSPAQVTPQTGASGVVRNPYYESPAIGSASPAPATAAGGWSSGGPNGPTPGVPPGWPAPVSLQPPSNVQAPSMSIAARPATGPGSGGFPSVAAGVPGGPLASPSAAATAWGNSPNTEGSLTSYSPSTYGSPQTPWSGGGQVPQAMQPQVPGTSGFYSPAPAANSSSWGAGGSAYPGTQAGPSAGPFSNVSPAPVYPTTSPGTWSLPTPGSDAAAPRVPGQETPYYPSTDSFRSGRPATQPMNAAPADSQVVPATYANPNSRSTPIGTSPQPGTTWDASRGSGTWPSTTPATQPYPAMGQAGYNLYPSSTLR